MRNGVPPLDIINPLPNRSHKAHAVDNLIHRRIIWKILNRLDYKLLLAHDPMLQHDGKIGNLSFSCFVLKAVHFRHPNLQHACDPNKSITLKLIDMAHHVVD